jgi:hypothetical protein
MFDCGGVAFSEAGFHASIAIGRLEDSTAPLPKSDLKSVILSAAKDQCNLTPVCNLPRVLERKISRGADLGWYNKQEPQWTKKT